MHNMLTNFSFYLLSFQISSKYKFNINWFKLKYLNYFFVLYLYISRIENWSEIFSQSTTSDKGVSGRRVLRCRKDSSSDGPYCVKFWGDFFSYLRRYDFLKSFSYNEPYGRKFIFKNYFPPNSNFYFLQTFLIQIWPIVASSGKVSFRL